MAKTPSIESDLAALLGDENVKATPATQAAYDRDAYPLEKSRPLAVAFPTSTEQVQTLIKWCLDKGMPYAPRGAGTGLSGGATSPSPGIVISTKKLTKILEIDLENKMLLAETGVVNANISKAVQEHGLHFAPDPSSQTVSTLGGNIAENSGGPHTLKYGVTANHVLQLTLVDPDGEIQELGSRNPGAPGPDLIDLVIGAEGTCGIVTRAWVKLTPNPKAVETALASFPSVQDASSAVTAIIASGITPAALEMVDHGILGALQKAFNLQYPPDAKALLLLECDSHDPKIAKHELDQIQEICRKHNSIGIEVAQNEEDRKRLWVARKKGIGAMGRLAPTIVTHDGVIPRSRLPEMLDYVYQIADEFGIRVANLFHAGDGNLHPCFYFDGRVKAQAEAAVKAGEKILAKCVEIGGSLTGEHGVGMEKMNLMKLMFTEEDLALQMSARRIFNAGELCNPCKVIPNQRGCAEHASSFHGAAW